MRRKRRGLLWVGLISLLLWTGVLGVQAKEDEKSRVLFISSYSYARDTVQIQIEGIKAGIGQNTVLDYEFMDTKRVSDETSMRQFYEGLAYRMSVVEPYDVVILGDDAALRFAVEYRETLFKDIPLVFEGVNDEELAMEVTADPLITGVVEKLSIEKNIELARRLIPDATKVVAILDNSITGEAERKAYYEFAESYQELEFSEINTSELTTDELRSALTAVSKDSILIYIMMTEDAQGRHYSASEAIDMITSNAKVPAFRMLEGGIGEGLLGGNIVSMYKSGEIAAEIAMKVIAGTYDIAGGVVQESPNFYCIDENVMRQFDLDVKLLPEETQIINQSVSIWEKNGDVLKPIIVVIGILVVIMLVIVIDNIRHRRLLRELEEARKIMESASQHDFLTGIPNRSKFMEDLQEMITEGKPCTLFMMDIDDFKHINDYYGHTAGDDALRQLAERLKKMSSQILTPYRYAGDEFIMILKGNQSKIVENTAYASRHLFVKPFKLAGEERKVCGSIGIASFPKDADTIEQLIVCADTAMYQVKKSGKNNYAFYDPSQQKPE